MKANRNQLKILFGFGLLSLPAIVWHHWGILAAMLATAAYMLWQSASAILHGI